MGADIHYRLEKREKGTTKWEHSYSGEPLEDHYLSRDYRMFAQMANVRGYGGNDCRPKGFPEDACDETKQCYFTVRYTKQEGQERHSLYGETVFVINEQYYGVDSDWHSASYMNADELEDAIHAVEHECNELFGRYNDYNVLLREMRSLEKAGYEVRIVYWFDN